MRAKAEIIEIRKDRQAIIVTEIPYQVNKAHCVEKISELVREKRVEGIAELRDESDRHGVRVVVEIKRDASADVVLNQLYRFSPLQTNFSVNMLALHHGRPEQLTLKQVLQAFLAFREEVITRRTKFTLGKARDRGHVIVGLAAAVANLDEVIRLIREAPDPNTARDELMRRAWPAKDTAPLVALIADPRSKLHEDGTIRLSFDQAKAILELRLHRLTGLGREELDEEARKISAQISDLLDILRSRVRVLDLIRQDLLKVKQAYAVPRRTEFLEGDFELEDEDLIARVDMVVTLSHGGYIKRTNLSDYRTQHRGGKGRAGMNTKDEDVVTKLFVASTHTPVLFFTSDGIVQKLKIWRLPLGAPQARGRALVNLLSLPVGSRVTSLMPLPDDEESWDRLDVMFATRSGKIRRNKLSDFSNVNRAGKIAMKLDDGDEIVDVQICTPEEDVLLTTRNGLCLRCAVTDVRVFSGRTSTGVRGIKLGRDDVVVSMVILHHMNVTSAQARAYMRHAIAMRRAAGIEGEENVNEAEIAPISEDEEEDASQISLSPEMLAQMGAAEQFILTVTSDGFGKRASSYDYRVTNRGGKGLKAHDLSRGGQIAASFPIEQGDEIMLVTDGGQLIRTSVNSIRIAGRATKGVTILRTKENEKVVAVERIGEQENGEQGELASEEENASAPEKPVEENNSESNQVSDPD